MRDAMDWLMGDEMVRQWEKVSKEEEQLKWQGISSGKGAKCTRIGCGA